MILTAAGLDSTNVALAAPRERASRPSAPDPAKKVEHVGSIHESRGSRMPPPEHGRTSAACRVLSARRSPRPCASPPRFAWREATRSTDRRRRRGRSRRSAALRSPRARPPLPRASSSSGRSATRRAYRKSVRPDWRLPSNSPAPRSSRSTSASWKPSDVSTSASRRGDRRLRQLFPGSRHEQAVRLLRPTPYPAAQLVELGEAEAVGFLHDHDRRVGHVDADLDHRGRDEHVQLARA